LLRPCIADLVGNSVADVVILGLVLGVSDGVALAFPDGGALLGGGDVVDSPADGLGSDPHSWGNCYGWGGPGDGRGAEVEPGVAPGSRTVASISIASSAGSVVPAVETSGGISLWLTQSQGCDKGKKSQKLVHFVCRT